MEANKPVKTIEELELELVALEQELEIRADEGFFIPDEVESYYALKKQILALTWEIKGLKALETLKKTPGIGFVKRVDFDGDLDE